MEGVNRRKIVPMGLDRGGSPNRPSSATGHAKNSVERWHGRLRISRSTSGPNLRDPLGYRFSSPGLVQVTKQTVESPSAFGVRRFFWSAAIYRRFWVPMWTRCVLPKRPTNDGPRVQSARAKSGDKSPHSKARTRRKRRAEHRLRRHYGCDAACG